jgi:uncharacterized membrane protein YhhN
MGDLLRKYIIPVYFLNVLINCLFLYFDLPYVAVTSSLLVPILLLYLFLNDQQISSSAGKFFFYIGLIFAFFGDVLQIVVKNELFFNSSLVAFMLMNGCYSISFYNLNPGGWKKPFPFLITILLLSVMGYVFILILGEAAEDYQLPLIIYLSTLVAMAAFAVQAAAHPLHRGIAVRYLIPGALIFLLQNAFFALNLFQQGGPSAGFIYSIIPYSIAQLLLVKGIEKAYL